MQGKIEGQILLSYITSLGGEAEIHSMILNTTLVAKIKMFTVKCCKALLMAPTEGKIKLELTEHTSAYLQ